MEGNKNFEHNASEDMRKEIGGQKLTGGQESIDDALDRKNLELSEILKKQAELKERALKYIDEVVALRSEIASTSRYTSKYDDLIDQLSLAQKEFIDISTTEEKLAEEKNKLDDEISAIKKQREKLAEKGEVAFGGLN